MRVAKRTVVAVAALGAVVLTSVCLVVVPLALAPGGCGTGLRLAQVELWVGSLFLHMEICRDHGDGIKEVARFLQEEKGLIRSGPHTPVRYLHHREDSTHNHSLGVVLYPTQEAERGVLWSYRCFGIERHSGTMFLLDGRIRDAIWQASYDAGALERALAPDGPLPSTRGGWDVARQFCSLDGPEEVGGDKATR